MAAAATPPDPSPSSEPGASPDPAGADRADGADGARQDVKRRFREALDRKQGRGGESAAGTEGGDHAKVHGGAHGPAQQQRQFRRKSG